MEQPPTENVSIHARTGAPSNVRMPSSRSTLIVRARLRRTSKANFDSTRRRVIRMRKLQRRLLRRPRLLDVGAYIANANPVGERRRIQAPRKLYADVPGLWHPGFTFRGGAEHNFPRLERWRWRRSVIVRGWFLGRWLWRWWSLRLPPAHGPTTPSGHLQPSAGIYPRLDRQIESPPARTEVRHPHGCVCRAQHEVIAALTRRTRLIAEQVAAAEFTDDGDVLPLEPPRLERERADRGRRRQLRFGDTRDVEDQLLARTRPALRIGQARAYARTRGSPGSSRPISII